MMRLWKGSLVALLLTMLVAALPAAADAPALTALADFRTDGMPIAGPFEVSQVLARFPPGACTPLHTHAGQVVITVLTGAQVRTGAGPESGTYTAGQSWVETPGPAHRACNTGTVDSTSIATYLLPKGAAISTPLPGQAPVPGPVTLAQSRVDGVPIAAPFDVVQNMFEFAPGACTGVHTHAGQVVVTVVDGTVTATSPAGTKAYTAGQSFAETAASPAHEACDAAGVSATIMVAYLLPKGAAIADPVAQPAASSSSAASAPPAPPRTGGGGEAAYIRRLGDG